MGVRSSYREKAYNARRARASPPPSPPPIYAERERERHAAFKGTERACGGLNDAAAACLVEQKQEELTWRMDVCTRFAVIIGRNGDGGGV